MKGVLHSRLKIAWAKLSLATKKLGQLAAGGVLASKSHGVAADVAVAPAWHESWEKDTATTQETVVAFFKKTLHVAKVQEIEKRTKAALDARSFFTDQVQKHSDLGTQGDDKALKLNMEAILTAKATKMSCLSGRVFLKSGWANKKISDTLLRYITDFQVFAKQSLDQDVDAKDHMFGPLYSIIIMEATA